MMIKKGEFQSGATLQYTQSAKDFLNDTSPFDHGQLKEPPKNRRFTLATFDIESTPFEYGVIPVPFCCGLYTEERYLQWWGDDCLEQFFYRLCDTTKRYRIYAHNGGKFDFVYLLRMGLFDRRVQMIGNRFVKTYIGGHEFRDSFSILPVALAVFGDKYTIDYNKNKPENQEANKEEILAYLKQDCKILFIAVEQFIARFGLALTIGSAALKMMRSMHPFNNRGPNEDAQLRRFYFGGRVQCFSKGLRKGSFKYYDVNSMYPYVMAEFQHFTGGYYDPVPNGYTDDYFNPLTGELKDKDKGKPYFIRFKGANNNALPTRMENGSLSFKVEYGEFFTTSFEVQVALKYGLIQIDEVLELLIPEVTINFKEYVHKFVAEKIKGKNDCNLFLELTSKFMLNSPYGKTGQNPDNYKENMIVERGDPDLHGMVHGDTHGGNWEIAFDYDDFMIMEKPSEKKTYYDVGIAASITGAARAVLLEAIVNADKPEYCDTDSLICKKLNGVEEHNTKLGAWALECTGTTLAIYDKKVYALFKGKSEVAVKSASKGVQITDKDIVRLAMGQSVSYVNDAPSFKLDGSTEFVQRILGSEKHSKLFDKFGDRI